MDFNKELEKEILEFHKTNDLNFYDNILNLLPYCILRTPTYLLNDPIFKDNKVVIQKDNTLIFNIIEDTEGKKYIPVFTSKEEYFKMLDIKDASIYHLEFKHIVDIFKIENDINGIAINPMGNNITIEKEVIFEINNLLEDM